MPVSAQSIGSAIAGLLAVAGLGCLWFGLFPRRRGDTPHCRRCGYNLTGAAARRCTECGADLTGQKSVVFGERRRRLALIVLGCLLSVVGLGGALLFALRAAAGVNFYHYAPLGWVVRDMEAGQPAKRAAAVAELQRRWNSSALSQSDCSALVDALLSEQMGPPAPGVSDKAINLLGTMITAGSASEEQTECFLSNLVRLSLRTRATVVAGRGVPFEAVATAVCPDVGFEAVVSVGDVQVDDRAALVKASGTFVLSGPNSRSARTGEIRLALDIGRHQAACDAKVEIYSTGAASVVGSAASRTAAPLRAYSVYLTSAFEIVATEAPDAYSVVSSAGIDAAIKSRLSLTDVKIEHAAADEPPRLSMQLQADAGLPEPIAGALEAELDGGRRIVIGLVRLGPSSSRHSYAVSAPCESPVPTQARIRLIPSREAAQLSVDLFRYWGGSIDFGEFELNPPRGNE